MQHNKDVDDLVRDIGNALAENDPDYLADLNEFDDKRLRLHLSPNSFVDDNVLEEDKKTMLDLAAARMNLMYCKVMLHRIILSVEYRFLELKMFNYQWKQRQIFINFSTPEEVAVLRVLERAISQFYHHLCDCFDLSDTEDPSIPNSERPMEFTEQEKMDIRFLNSLPAERQQDALSAVNLLSYVKRVIAVYDEQLASRHNLTPTQRSISLDRIQEWYQKLTFFMHKLTTILRVERNTLIVVYRYDEPGREEERWSRMAALETVRFAEIDPPSTVPEIDRPPGMSQEKLDKLLTSILGQCELSVSTNGFDSAAMSTFLQDRWEKAFTKKGVVIYEDGVLRNRRKVDVPRAKKKYKKK